MDHAGFDDHSEDTDPRSGELAAPVAGTSEALLVVLTGPTIGRSYHIEEGQLTIGRDESCEVFVPDPAMSRRHAQVLRDGDQFFVTDLGSTNGTHVDGERIKVPWKLADGARIMLGANTIVKFSHLDSLEASVQKRITDALYSDPLTGARNRRYLELRMREEVSYARRHQRSLTILLLDIDHFKKVNDEHGHPAGDDVLKGLADLLQQSIRREDVLCRYGGEEFLIIARGLVVEQGLQFAHRLRPLVAGTAIPTRERELSVTISIGVATFNLELEDDPDRLFARADEALYRAKTGGRNRVEQERLDAM